MTDNRLTVGDGFRFAFGFWLCSLFLSVIAFAFSVLALGWTVFSLQPR